MALPATNPIDLTTLAKVKSRAEAVGTNDDQDIQDAITAFSQWIIDYTGKASLNSVGSYDELYDGNGNSRMFLRNSPIQSLTQVIINGVSIPLSAAFGQWGAIIDQSKKSISLRGGIGNFSTFPYPSYAAFRRNSGNPTFQQGIANIEVLYTAGQPPATSTNEVVNVVAQTVALRYAPWASDGGVRYYPSLTPLVNVPSAPGVGQYAVSSGLYVFNIGDNGNVVAVTYTYNAAPYDLEYAVRCAVAINYKRKSWQDQKSKATTSGGTAATTSYRDWTWPPECQLVFDHYKRLAIIT